MVNLSLRCLLSREAFLWNECSVLFGFESISSVSFFYCVLIWRDVCLFPFFHLYKTHKMKRSKRPSQHCTSHVLCFSFTCHKRNMGHSRIYGFLGTQICQVTYQHNICVPQQFLTFCWKIVLSYCHVNHHRVEKLHWS